MNTPPIEKCLVCKSTLKPLPGNLMACTQCNHTYHEVNGQWVLFIARVNSPVPFDPKKQQDNLDTIHA